MQFSFQGLYNNRTSISSAHNRITIIRKNQEHKRKARANRSCSHCHHEKMYFKKRMRLSTSLIIKMMTLSGGGKGEK